MSGDLGEGSGETFSQREEMRQVSKTIGFEPTLS